MIAIYPNNVGWVEIRKSFVGFRSSTQPTNIAHYNYFGTRIETQQGKFVLMPFIQNIVYRSEKIPRASLLLSCSDRYSIADAQAVNLNYSHIGMYGYIGPGVQRINWVSIL
jgi:hypothetical protein